MASIEERPGKGGTAYRVIWRQDGQRETETLGTRIDAERFRLDVEEAGGRWPLGWVPKFGYTTERPEPEAQPAASLARRGTPHPLTVAQWALAWIDSDRCRAQVEARRKYRNQVRDHIADQTLGSMAVAAVRREHVQAWLEALADAGLSYKTLKNLRGLLSAVMKAGVAEGKVTRGNPVDSCAIPAKADPLDARSPVFLTHAEYADILLGIPAVDRPIVETIAGTGMRPGEMWALQVRDLDLTGGIPVIAVNKARKHSGDGDHRIGTPKTRAGMRTVTISAHLATVLAEHVEGKASTDLVFTPGNTSTWDRNVWAPAVAGAMLPVKPRFYDLRHSHASWLLAAGEPLFLVSKRLGHASLTITSDVYGHLDRSGNAQLVERLNAIDAGRVAVTR